MPANARTTRVPLVERVLEANNEVAAVTRADLERRGIFAVDLIGAPGSGKTALLEATLRALAGRRHPAVLVGDLATRRDGDRLARWCDQVVQISTGQGCHLEANQVRDALAQIDLDAVDLLFIENVGNLICPVGIRPGPGGQGRPVQPDRGRGQGGQAPLPGGGGRPAAAQQDRPAAIRRVRPLGVRGGRPPAQSAGADPGRLRDDGRGPGGLDRLARPVVLRLAETGTPLAVLHVRVARADERAASPGAPAVNPRRLRSTRSRRAPCPWASRAPSSRGTRGSPAASGRSRR